MGLEARGAWTRLPAPTSTQPSDLGKPQDLPVSHHHLGKSNQAKHNKNGNHAARRYSALCGPSCFPGLPRPGPQDTGQCVWRPCWLGWESLGNLPLAGQSVLPHLALLTLGAGSFLFCKGLSSSLQASPLPPVKETKNISRECQV